jgi:hypothetical protein
MHLIHPPEPVGVLVIVKIAHDAHPLMPRADVILHSLEGKVKAKPAKVLPHMLRHPVLTLVNQARVILLSMVKVKMRKASHRVTTPPVP